VTFPNKIIFYGAPFLYIQYAIQHKLNELIKRSICVFEIASHRQDILYVGNVLNGV
jgi:hypothetical protein